MRILNLPQTKESLIKYINNSKKNTGSGLNFERGFFTWDKCKKTKRLIVRIVLSSFSNETNRENQTQPYN